jgi:hypothetical protein
MPISTCRRRWAGLAMAVLCATAPVAAQAATLAKALQGGWMAKDYSRKEGGVVFPIRGALLFAGDHWAMNYLVMMPDGQVQRSFAAEGVFTLAGDHINLLSDTIIQSPGVAIEGMPATAGQVRALDLKTAKPRVATLKIEGDMLTVVYDNNGSRMAFTRGPSR